MANKKEETKDPILESDTVSKPDKLNNSIDDSTDLKENLNKAPINQIYKDSINCDTVFIQADAQIEESCEERATGKIVVKVSSAKGALPPYSVSIDNGRSYQSQSIIDRLMPGNYTIWLKDKNNCQMKVGSYLIGSMICDYEFIFAPDKGERWEIPSKDRNGILKIYSKQGKLVYTQNFDEGQQYYWDGTSLNRNPQPMGVYRFIMEFDNDEPVVGNVTIVR